MTLQQNSEINDLSYVCQIASAYVAAHQTPLENLPVIIRQIYYALSRIDTSPTVKYKTNDNPFVPINESVYDDYIICLEDGKKLQLLKRHLNTTYGMTLEHYKERWNLPKDYPTVAPNYAKRRSEIAHSFGLGKGKRGKSKLKVS
jgi:predicted transcriptional regulator